MHNHNEKSGNGIMWMMAICCGLPILFILVSGAGGKALGAPTWVIFGGVMVMLAVHFFAMRKPHKHADEKKEAAGGENREKEGKADSNHGCCH